MVPVLIPAPVCVEEHEEVRETITTGPYGEQTVTLSVEDDVHVHSENIINTVKFVAPIF
jgi:hypothetical protein